MDRLSGIIEGEAALAGCHMLALIAVAYVYTRNSKMYGYHSPSAISFLIASTYEYFPDFSYGSDYVFGVMDLQNPEVRRIIAEGEVRVIYPCEWGKALIFVARE